MMPRTVVRPGPLENVEVTTPGSFGARVLISWAVVWPGTLVNVEVYSLRQYSSTRGDSEGRCATARSGECQHDHLSQLCGICVLIPRAAVRPGLLQNVEVTTSGSFGAHIPIP